MEHTPIHVVVSDLVMPKMDGAQFLNEVMRRFPDTIRFILSGHIGPEDVAKCIRALHQYLRKPCDFSTLKTTLIRVCSLEVFLQNKPLQKLVTSMGIVPSLPSLYFRMVQELESPNSPMELIAAVVEQDPGMAAKLLQLTNSAAFGIQQKVLTPAEAIQFLGVNTVRSLALYFHAFACFEQAKVTEFAFGQHWSHCFNTGVTARMISQIETGDSLLGDEAFIAGLLHDIGQLMLISNLTDQYRSALVLAREKGIFLWEAEQEIFGATHADVGAYLLGLWGLPVSILEAVALHHTPGRAGNQVFCPLTAIHVADVLDYEHSGGDFAGASAQLDKEYLAKLGLSDRMGNWRMVFNQVSGQTSRS
jgi:HD-like signal output (HDOD) protein